MIGFTEKAVCRKIANTFEMAAREKFHPVEFVTCWLQSDVCERLIQLDFNDIAQSPLYQLNSFKMENERKKKMISKDEQENGALLYWAGYLFMYWMYKDDIPGTKITELYDIEGVLTRYETLHTLSCDVAIEEIKENWNICENIKREIFGK